MILKNNTTLHSISKPFSPDNYVEKLRFLELDLVKSYFPYGNRVLEIGGGNGYQASVLYKWGCDVTSIDIVSQSINEHNFYKVQIYDGQHFPYPKNSFDRVFSSNTLEHIIYLSDILLEIRRVLRPGGIAVHILPSVTWRFWTTITHFPHLLKLIFPSHKKKTDIPSNHAIKKLLNQHDFSYYLKAALFDSPHGAYPNAISELYYYSRRRWLRVFFNYGFDVTDVLFNGIYYSGYKLFPGLPIRLRQALSLLLGSSCNIFIMRHKKHIQ